ncbi:MAG TPA: serine hydrolase [Chloroflexota bacterium]|nr:serine hydrolase [Chloroflexota bacterium]
MPQSPAPRSRPPASRSPRGQSLVGAIVAYVLVGTFIGVLGWKLVETAADTRRLSTFERPDVATAQLPTAATAYRDAQLAELLQRQLPAIGAVGYYVKNLTTGAEAEVNSERVFPAASLYKLPIMVEVIRQVRVRRLSMDQEVVIGREHWVAGSGVLQARVGESLSVRELLRLLIVESDNIAAMTLLDVVGLENVNQTMQGMGLRSTRLMDYRAPGAYSGPGPYTTTPADMGLLFDVVATGKLVDTSGSEEALRLLEKKQANEWLSEGLPWWAKLAHKWGDIPSARHDAGVVFTPRSQYVVVVMTEGLDLQRASDQIRDTSRLAFNYFEGPR